MKRGLLPWPELLRAGRALGLAPDVMWRLSLREWLWLTAGAEAAAMDAAGLAALMAAHPDDREPEDPKHG